MRTFVGAIRATADRLALRAYAPPEWCDAMECARWAAVLRRAHHALDGAVREGARSYEPRPLAAYRRARDLVLDALESFCDEVELRGEVESLAFDAVAQEVVPILLDADRAPRWLRDLARWART